MNLVAFSLPLLTRASAGAYQVASAPERTDNLATYDEARGERLEKGIRRVSLKEREIKEALKGDLGGSWLFERAGILVLWNLFWN